jgi:hypothetical protein
LDSGSTRRQAQGVPIPGAVEGTYVEFESMPELQLALESLDSSAAGGARLVSVHEDVVGNHRVERAVVWVPEGGHASFLRRFEQYAATVDQEKPRNSPLLDRIASIRLATLRSLWTDEPSEFPSGDAAVWWELWLRRRDGQEWPRAEFFAAGAGLTLAPRRLAFPDRLVALCSATPESLARALDSLDDLAELRRPRPLARLITELTARRQVEVAQELVDRMEAAPDGAPAVSLLDTGVFRQHPLLSSSLAPADCHAYNPAWRLDDERGHGTRMAGLALLGRVDEVISRPEAIKLSHRLESVRILPPAGQQNPPDLYGAITASAVSRLEVQAPGRQRAVVLAVTAETSLLDGQRQRTPTVGQPTSWSAAVDALAVGLGVGGTATNPVFLREDDEAPHRLILISAGNVSEYSADYLTRSELEVVSDPGQSWNAVTVGAYTELTAITDPTFRGWRPVADAGELSPYSRTSVAFNRAWPAKPDIVLEGGNIAQSPGATDFDEPEDLALLTTRSMTLEPRPFGIIRATSAATAQAGYIAASIMAEYPDAWPETVRALLVHSAEWTAPMLAQFDGARPRTAVDALRRRYGMGVPSLVRAIRSASDAVTLIVQDVIHPYNDGAMAEMSVHELPWPTDVLSSLGAVDVELRVTLSYFIEPNPGRRGWVRRYAYPSHGLRWSLIRPTESVDQFRRRINRRARAGVQDRSWATGPDRGWRFGSDLRTVGSLHTDIWTGSAANLARRGVIAVYPVSGWWKEREDWDRSQLGARYALIVSINAPDVDVDIWNAVMTELEILLETPIET